MQNIVIVCADKELRKDISKNVASKLNFLFVDADDILDYEVLNNEGATLKDCGDVLNKLEKKVFDRVLNFDNCVITMSRDLFVSNDNFRLLNSFFKVFVGLSKAHFIARAISKDKFKLEQDLQMYDKINLLVKSNCDLEIEKDIKSVEEISAEIINKVNN